MEEGAYCTRFCGDAMLSPSAFVSVVLCECCLESAARKRFPLWLASPPKESLYCARICLMARSVRFINRRPPTLVVGSSHTTSPVASTRSLRFEDNQNCNVLAGPRGENDSKARPDSEKSRIFPPSSPKI